MLFHSKVGRALDLDFELSVCDGILNCGFNIKKDIKQCPVTISIHMDEIILAADVYFF